MSFSMASDSKTRLGKIGFVSAIFYLALTGGGGCNIFGDLGKNNSDDAIMFHAQQQIDASQWTDAIATLGTLSTAGQNNPSAKLLLATAYAGRGGLNLLGLSQKLQNASGQTFFQFLMTTFTGVTGGQLSDLTTAEGIIQSIAVNAALRNADENIFMMFLEMAKLGSILSFLADTNGDGVLDAGFDSCLNVANIYADHTVTAISNIIASSAAAGSNIGGGFINGLSAQCGALPGVCNVFQTAGVTVVEESIAKTLIGETALGIGLAVPAETNICEIPPNGANCHGSGTGLCP